MSKDIKIASVDGIILALVGHKAHKAVKYLGHSYIIRATRKLQGKKVGSGNIEILLTIGRPNVYERKSIDAAKKAGKSFPLQAIHLKYPPHSQPKKPLNK